MDERLAKTIAAIRESGADWGVFTSPDGVAYALGHVCAIEAGPSPFAGGPSLAIVGVNGETGLLVPPERPELLASAIAHLLDHPERAARMAGRARERVDGFCDAAALGRALTAAYLGP